MWRQQEVCFISLNNLILIIIMSGYSYHDQKQHKTRKNMLKIIIITTAIGAVVAAIGAFLFGALWLLGW
jgi:cytochrome bd-type quinol oxidase subunit 1